MVEASFNLRNVGQKKEISSSSSGLPGRELTWFLSLGKKDTKPEEKERPKGIIGFSSKREKRVEADS